MNTEKVFTAFNKDGKEILLYRKDNNTYIDLNSDNNEVILKEDIDFETLNYVSKSINLRKHMFESSIKRKYKKDREKLIEAKKVLLGVKLIISDLKELEIDSGLRWYDIPIYDTRYEWGTKNNKVMGLYIFSKMLKIKKDDEVYSFNLYKNLVDFENYLAFYDNPKNISKNPNFGNGMEFVYLNNYNLEDIIKERYVEKKKVLEYANEVRKEIIKEGSK